MTVFISGNTWKNLNTALAASTIWVTSSILLKITLTTATTAQNQAIGSFSLLNSIINFLRLVYLS